MIATPLIELHDLCKNYGPNTAVDHVNLTFAGNDAFGFPLPGTSEGARKLAGLPAGGLIVLSSKVVPLALVRLRVDHIAEE